MGDERREVGIPSHPNLQTTAWALPLFLRVSIPSVLFYPHHLTPRRPLLIVSPSVPGVSVSLLEPLWGWTCPSWTNSYCRALFQAATIPSCEHLPQPKIPHSIWDAL